MVSLTATTDRVDGVTLVTLCVENTGPAREIRVENRLDGPVWPPRRHGRPAAGWDQSGFEGVVGADGRLSLGYASPGEPADPPAAVVAVEPVGERGDGDSEGRPNGTEQQTESGTPAGVVRSLGDPLVPREGVPVPDAPTPRVGRRRERDSTPNAQSSEGARLERVREAAFDGETGDRPDPTGAPAERAPRQEWTGRRSAERRAALPQQPHTSEVSSRLAAIERRLATLEGR